MKRQKEKSFDAGKNCWDAAIREFGEKGFEKASLNRILQEARISKGTFYYHFENKEDLYFYLISTVIERKKQFLSQALNPSAGQGDLFAIFRLYAQTGLDFARLNPDVQRFAESFAREKAAKFTRKHSGGFTIRKTRLSETWWNRHTVGANCGRICRLPSCGT